MTRTEQNTLNETWKRNLSNSHLIAPTSSKKETFVKKKNLNEIIDRYATEKFQKKPTNNRIETHSTKNNRVRFAANAFLSPPTRPRDIRNRRVNNPEGGWFRNKPPRVAHRGDPPRSKTTVTVVSPAKKEAASWNVASPAAKAGKKKGGCFPRSAPRFQSKV